MEYLLMQPLFEMKPFKDMTKREAQSHFDWYIGEIPNRIDLLKNAYSAMSGRDKEELDYSSESLFKLWQWYVNNLEVEEKSEEIKKLEREQYPGWIQVNISNKKISIGWMSIAMDIAIYFSECFIKEHGTIRWSFVLKPKSLAYINKPVLVGFKNGLDLDSTNIVRVLTSKIVDGEKDSNALLEIYITWSEKVQKFTYQKQITGKEGQAFLHNGVKFDGVNNGTLIEAKGSYNNFVNKKTGEFYDWFNGKDSLV